MEYQNGKWEIKPISLKVSTFQFKSKEFRMKQMRRIALSALATAAILSLAGLMGCNDNATDPTGDTTPQLPVLVNNEDGVLNVAEVDQLWDPSLNWAMFRDGTVEPKANAEIAIENSIVNKSYDPSSQKSVKLTLTKGGWGCGATANVGTQDLSAYNSINVYVKSDSAFSVYLDLIEADGDSLHKGETWRLPDTKILQYTPTTANGGWVKLTANFADLTHFIYGAPGDGLFTKESINRVALYFPSFTGVVYVDEMFVE
jgi:hypothetical protein